MQAAKKWNDDVQWLLPASVCKAQVSKGCLGSDSKAVQSANEALQRSSDMGWDPHCSKSQSRKPPNSRREYSWSRDRSLKLESIHMTFLSTAMSAIITITDFQHTFRFETDNPRLHLNMPVSPASAALEWLTLTDVSRKHVGWRRWSRTYFFLS